MEKQAASPGASAGWPPVRTGPVCTPCPACGNPHPTTRHTVIHENGREEGCNACRRGLPESVAPALRVLHEIGAMKVHATDAHVRDIKERRVADPAATRTHVFRERPKHAVTVGFGRNA